MTASQSKTIATKPQPKTYGKIILTLYNQLLPESVFKETPSRVDGLDPETETDLRILGCELVQTAGILLKLPQVAMATGQIYLQRFYYSKSFVRYPMEVTAMASVYLASKIEESPCRIRDVINVFHHVKQVRAQKPITPLIVDNSYIELKNQVIKAERRILKELGFCVHIKHPHKLIVVYLQLLSYEKNRKLAQMSWNYMNDALRTDVFMRFPPENIACACIYLTARKIGLPLPKNPHWFSLFSVKEEDIRDICTRILMLYRRPKVHTEEMDKKVDLLRRVYQANKILQSQNKERESKKEKSPLPSTSKEDKKSAIKSTTPPLKHHSRKSKHERRTRSRSYERKRHTSKRHRSRSSTPRKERSRDDRRDEKKRSKKYEEIERSKKYEDTERSKKYEDTERSKKYEDTERSKKYEDTERSKKYEDTERSKKYDENERSKKYDDDRMKKYSDDYERPSKSREEKEKRKH